MAENKYYYLSDPLYETVKDSQVINWIQLLEEKNKRIDLILVSPVRYLVQNRKLRKEKIKDSKRKIKGKLFEVPIFKAQDKTGVSELIKIFFFVVIMLPCYLQGKRIIVHTRNYTHFGSLKVLKYLFKIKILFDLRGASAEEFLYEKGYNDINIVQYENTKKRYLSILNKQISMVKISSNIFCVSNKLKDYINIKTDCKFNQKLVVVPGAADNDTFFFNAQLRQNIREKENIREKYVVCYTGKLDRPWHMGDFLFNTISQILDKYKDTFFLCITPDKETAEKYINRYSINETRISCKFIKYDFINSYLNAADCGLVMREDVPTNNVASPTKIAEYLLTGLPLLMSDKIGDYSDYVKTHSLGKVIENDVIVAVNMLGVLKTMQIDRKQTAQFCSKTYSKQVNIHKMLGIYDSI
ncbi:MAG: hypothetical protein K8R67_15535 [Desulfobacteraceae bacterium]|nr:hypothetical protein [Desulfobacteraceae bacterium]